MFKSVLATLGGVAVVAGIAVWQFGFFSAKTAEVKLQMTRATASARVEKAIAAKRASIESLDEKARNYKVQARKLELSYEREKAEVDKLRDAITKLSEAAKEAGLPKPGDALELTSEQEKTTLEFNGKTITARELYEILPEWFERYKSLRETVEEKEKTINRYRDVAEKLESKKGPMELELAKMESKVKELETERDLARIDNELTEMEASVNDIKAGDAGKAMADIQEEIDELRARADQNKEDAQTSEKLNPNDLLVDPKTIDSELDAFWN